MEERDFSGGPRAQGSSIEMANVVFGASLDLQKAQGPGCQQLCSGQESCSEAALNSSRTRNSHRQTGPAPWCYILTYP